MTRSNLNGLFFGVLLLALISCKKGDDTTGTTEPKTRTDFLTLQPWKPVSDKIDGNELIQDCQKDDKYTFFDNGTYSEDFGTLRCNSELNTSGNTWSFTNNETTLVLNGSVSFELVTLSKDSLVLRFGLEVISYVPY